MPLLTNNAPARTEPRRVGFFRLNIEFLQELLDLPKGCSIVGVTPNGDCSSLEIRVAGESVPDNGPNWCMSPLVNLNEGTAKDGSTVRQVQFVAWDGYTRQKAEQDAKAWYERHGKEPISYEVHPEQWRWWLLSPSKDNHLPHELPHEVFCRLAAEHNQCMYTTHEAAVSAALRAITEAIEAGELQ